MKPDWKCLFGLVLGLVCLVQPTGAEIWIEPFKVKQGQIIELGGHNPEYLNWDCYVQFLGAKYAFHSAGESENNLMIRLPTTPNSPLGQQEVTLVCPNQEKEVYTVEIIDGGFELQSITLTASKNSLSATEKEKKAVAAAIKTETRYQLWPDLPWAAPSKARRSSPYGVRRKYNGVLAKDYFHKGLDFAANAGEPIIAPADGVVVLAGLEQEGFAVHGNCLFIDHGQGVVSSYLHLSQALVKEGDPVIRGQLIGKVGDTGIATGPHLHWGVYLHGENIDPSPWLVELK